MHAETVLVTTGFPFGLSNASQIVAFGRNGNDDWNCMNNYPTLPVSVGGAVGGIFNDGTIIICGGYKGYTQMFEATCYLLSSGSNDIDEVLMLSQRYMAASVVFDGTQLFVTGGYFKADRLFY